jgi:hypothetical protein
LPFRDTNGKSLTVQEDFKIELFVADGGIFPQESKVLSAWLYTDSILDDELCLSKETLDILAEDTRDKTVEGSFTCSLHFAPDLNCGEDGILEQEQISANDINELRAKAEAQARDDWPTCSKDGFVVNIVTEKCKWYQARLVVLHSNYVKLCPICATGEIDSETARWFKSFGFSSTSSSARSSTYTTDAMYDLGYSKNNQFSTTFSSSYTSSSDSEVHDLTLHEFTDTTQCEQGFRQFCSSGEGFLLSPSDSTSASAPTHSEDIVFHMSKVAKFHREFPQGNSGSKGVKVTGSNLNGDTIFIRFRNGKALQLISSDALKIMLELNRAAHAVDSAQMEHMMVLYNILSRTLPHGQQSRHCIHDSSLEHSLTIIFHAAFPDRELPAFEAAEWKLFGCVQRIADPDLVLQPFLMDNYVNSRRIYVEPVAIELLEFYSMHYNSMFRKIVLQEDNCWKHYKVFDVSVVITRMILLRLGLRELSKGSRLAEWTQRPSDLLLCMTSFQQDCISAPQFSKEKGKSLSLCQVTQSFRHLVSADVTAHM